jgi:acyl-CoA thioester hydrolase
MAEPKSQHEFNYTISMRDTDATGIVFHPRYLEILTAARESLAKQIGLDQTNILKQYGCALVAHSIDVKFYQPCYLGEEIIVKTKIDRSHIAKIYITQEIEKTDLAKNKALNAQLTFVFIDKLTMQPAPFLKSY